MYLSQVPAPIESGHPQNRVLESVQHFVENLKNLFENHPLDCYRYKLKQAKPGPSQVYQLAFCHDLPMVAIPTD